MVGEVDEDVVRRVVGAVPGQLDALTADVQGVRSAKVTSGAGRAGSLSRSSSRRVSSCPTRTTSSEQRGRAGVVGVVMGVDQVRHLVGHAVGGGDLVDGPLEVVADGRGASNSTTPSRVVRNADW